MRKLLLLVILSLSITVLLANVNGLVFNDINGNELFDANDYAIENASVEIYDNTGLFSESVSTNSDGSYFFSNLSSGNYTIKVCHQDCFCSESSFFLSNVDEAYMQNIPLKCNVIDLALTLTLADNQPSYFGVGDLVTFDVTVYNQGTLDAAIVDVINYIPDGLVLNDGNWFILSENIALTQIIGPILPGTSKKTAIRLFVEDDSYCSITNIAEVLYQADIDSKSDLFAFNDRVLDNEINNGSEDEDDHDIETIDIDCSICPAVIDLGDATIPNGLYEAAHSIRSSGNVPVGNNVNLQAGARIYLENDFKVESNVSFKAYIAPCICNVDAPEFLVVDDVLGNEISLSWNAVPNVNQYQLAYYIDGVFIGNFYTSTNHLTIPLEDSGLNHEFTIFSVCENGDNSQGPTIGYTLSQDCSTCLPPRDFDVRFTQNGEIVFNWETVESGNYYILEFLDENGDPILNANGEPLQIFSDSDIATLNLNQFEEGTFPDVFEVVLSVVCERPIGAKQVLVESCHSLSVIVVTVEDEAARQAYCSLNGNQKYKIKCPHFPFAVSINKFKSCHCDENGNALEENSEINCDN